MKIAIGADHAGFEAKEKIISFMKDNKIYYHDFGTYSNDSVDYPDFAHPVANAVEKKEYDFGILICGSGQGVNITANKHQGIRSALCWNKQIAALSRQHNDANVLAIPGRFLNDKEIIDVVEAFLNTAFEGGRHANRTQKFLAEKVLNMKRQDFIHKVDQYLIDPENIKLQTQKNNKVNRQVDLAKTFFDKYELAIQRSSYLKNKSLENTDKLLANFEFDLNNTKVKVIWATDTSDALQEIANISKQQNLPVYFDHSQIINELDKDFQSAKFNINKATDFSERFIALSKADFIVADSSSIVCLNHEKTTKQIQGNAIAQIFVCGIDAVIQSFNDLELIAALQSTNKYGEPIHANINIYNGNKLNEDDALKEDLYVILLDNGRSQILADHEQRSLLNCIHCNACTRSCPVALFSGEKAYGTVYTGPYGALVSQHIEQNDDLAHLAFASTLCSKCNEVCPMNIDISSFLAYSRRNAVKNKIVSKTENLTIYFWKNAVMKRSNMDKGGAKVKGFMFKQILRKAWGNKREMPAVATKSFNQMWRERKDLAG